MAVVHHDKDQVSKEDLKAATYVKKLNEGRYLLVVRGNRFDIEHLEDILESLEK